MPRRGQFACRMRTSVGEGGVSTLEEEEELIPTRLVRTGVFFVCVVISHDASWP